MRNTVTLAACALALACCWSAAGATCSPTGFNGLTAALVNPTQTVTGDVDATGCHMGVYYSSGYGTVNKANIHGAQRYGVFVNGDVGVTTVNILKSEIHQIGDSQLSGNQYGIGIYYRGYGTGAAIGKISGNRIYKYQKGGIVANGAVTTVNVSDNVVTGEGAITYTAQNGIQIGYGATAQVMRNQVSGNAYVRDNDWSSAGILVVGEGDATYRYTIGTQIVGNTLENNTVAIYLSNSPDGYAPPTTTTNIKVVNNVITTTLTTDVYQAGVAVIGNGDKVISNTIKGYSLAIDTDPSYSPGVKVHATKD